MRILLTEAKGRVGVSLQGIQGKSLLTVFQVINMIVNHNLSLLAKTIAIFSQRITNLFITKWHAAVSDII